MKKEDLVHHLSSQVSEAAAVGGRSGVGLTYGYVVPEFLTVNYLLRSGTAFHSGNIITKPWEF